MIRKRNFKMWNQFLKKISESEKYLNQSNKQTKQQNSKK